MTRTFRRVLISLSDDRQVAKVDCDSAMLRNRESPFRAATETLHDHTFKDIRSRAFLYVRSLARNPSSTSPVTVRTTPVGRHRHGPQCSHPDYCSVGSGFASFTHKLVSSGSCSLLGSLRPSPGLHAVCPRARKFPALGPTLPLWSRGQRHALGFCGLFVFQVTKRSPPDLARLRSSGNGIGICRDAVADA